MASQPEDSSSLVLSKKKDKDTQLTTTTKSKSDSNKNDGALTKAPRTSKLASPNMQLTNGHEGEILTCRFDPSGKYIASSGVDRTICLWEVYGECKNYGVLKGHKGAILELQCQIYSACSDGSVGVWDSCTGQIVKRIRGHNAQVNSVCPQLKFSAGQGTLVTGSDDRTLKVWDLRRKQPVTTIDFQTPVTAVTFSQNGDTAFAATLDDTIQAIDLRQEYSLYELAGHTDIITGIRLSPNGESLLSYAMDNTAKTWDVKPFSATNRQLLTFEGAPHGFEKNLIKPSWSNDDSLVATGGGDRSTTVWSTDDATLLYKLPGHKGCVNSVDFHPLEPIILSGSTDRTMFLGEIYMSV